VSTVAAGSRARTVRLCPAGTGMVKVAAGPVSVPPGGLLHITLGFCGSVVNVTSVSF